MGSTPQISTRLHHLRPFKPPFTVIRQCGQETPGEAKTLIRKEEQNR